MKRAYCQKHSSPSIQTLVIVDVLEYVRLCHASNITYSGMGSKTWVHFFLFSLLLCSLRLLLPHRAPVALAPPPSTDPPPGSEDEYSFPGIFPTPEAVAPDNPRHLWDAARKRPKAY